MRFGIDKYMNIRGATTPSFSPDGKTLAYLTNTTGVPQVWSVDVEMPVPEQVTFYDERVAQMAYSPTSREILFTMDTGGNERTQIYLTKDDGSVCYQLTERPDSIHTLGGWSPDGRKIAFSSNARDPRFFDIYVLDVASRTSARVLEHDGTNHIAGWDATGEGLVVRRSTSGWDHELLYVDLRTRDCRRITPGSGEAVYNKVIPIPGGGGFYVTTNAGRDFIGIATLDFNQRLEYVVAHDWDVEGMALSPDGRRLAYSINRDGYSELHIVDTGTWKEMPVPPMPRGVLGSQVLTGTEPVDLTWSPTGTRLSVTFSGATWNHDIWLLDLEKMTSQRLTRSARAGVPQDSMVEPDLIRYPTFDGLQIPAFFYKPGDQAGRLPVVVYVHGGPASQSRPMFNPVIQFLVNRGYAVFVPNVRGSTGYGKEFSHLDDVRKRMDSVKDLAYGALWLKSQPDVDPHRIAVMGGSYGGFMVLSAITTYPDLWAAGVDLYGIANFETFLLNTGPWRRKNREAEYGSLEHDLEFLREVSPIHHVDNIRCPLMVIHGKNDPRVPFGETLQMVERITGRGGVVESVYFDDEGHGIVKLKNKLTAYPAIADFLDKYVAARK